MLSKNWSLAVPTVILGMLFAILMCQNQQLQGQLDQLQEKQTQLNDQTHRIWKIAEDAREAELAAKAEQAKK